jgi:Zn-dependent protease with chaperone function
VSSQFFERQETQRQATRWLVFGFIAAILLVVVAINLVGILAFGESPLRVVRDEPHVVIWVSAFVAGVILVATWHKSSQLRAGGAAVARSLGGIGIGTGETDFARKRLLNIVEEMAIAARVRKPMVFVLPDEQGINAFAAGHSPDEAAVAVTQGALDQLDRDQLQAIIGHEFSHILNGDMKINMRLAAWIFGLFVVTDLALRLLRVRSRGKGAAQLKIFALGVFIAGSVGMIAGRLLQAAVSRRREHLADASSVQFTRNPAALQSAFIIMAASQQGSRLEHPASADVAHMFFANSAPSWADKVGGSWFATHPPIEERVHALDNRITPIRFRTLVSDERRKMTARQSTAGKDSAPAAPAAPAAADATQGNVVTPDVLAMPIAAAVSMAAEPAPASSGPVSASPAGSAAPMALAETMPSGIRLVGGRALPPDVLRNRLSVEQQAAITQFVAQAEGSTHAAQGAFVASMLATEPAKWRPQLTKLASMLGIELLRESQAQVARLAQLPPPARLPALIDLCNLLDTMDPAHRKRLRALARAFTPTVATGDMLRYAVTRVLERKLAKAAEPPPPVPLPERAEAVCTLYAALAQCRFGAGKAGQNSYRAGLIGMVPPPKWAPYPETLLTPAQLDAAMEAARQIHPTGKKAFSEGLARVVAVGGRLTVPQVDLLRGLCILVDCAVPPLPVDVVYEENEPAPAAQASAR